jgi:hypothetical protein
MNKNSLQDSYIQNQHKSSWIDDPFGLGFTGVEPVSHDEQLSNYANELVGSYAKYDGESYALDLDSLSDPLQLELARLYIETIDREIEWACYGEDETLNSNFLTALLAMLKNSTPKTRTHFAQVTTQNVLIYYKKILQEILDTACAEYYCNDMHDSFCMANQDLEVGVNING